MTAARTVLALDLSSPHGVISVAREGREVYQASFVAERSHNAQVFAPLGEALEAAGTGPALVVVGTGPGSYTGVRIAIAAAQGVALSRGWPVIGWPSITTGPEATAQIIGDARRGQYYITCVTERECGPIEILDADTVRLRAGTGGEWYSFDAKPPLDLPQVKLCKPDARALALHVAALSEERLTELAARTLEPVYLQEAFITTARKAGKAVPAGI